MRKRKDLSLDEVIRLFIPIQQRIQQESDGFLRDADSALQSHS